MMITTEFELMQASADAEQEAQEALEKFLHEWLGKRRKAKPQMPQTPMPTQTPAAGPQVNYG